MTYSFTHYYPPLKSYLDSFHWTESNVSKELCRGRRRQIEGGLVQVCILLPNHGRVLVLEELVEAELAETLHGVADQGWCPAQEEAPRTLLRHGELESVAQALVLLLVHLQPALHQVERGHLARPMLIQTNKIGVSTKVWVMPQLRTPPKAQSAKYLHFKRIK